MPADLRTITGIKNTLFDRMKASPELMQRALDTIDQMEKDGRYSQGKGLDWAIRVNHNVLGYSAEDIKKINDDETFHKKVLAEACPEHAGGCPA